MYLNKSQVQSPTSKTGRRATYCLLLTAFCIMAAGCGVRFDMQDQPRYEVYRKSDFFDDGRSSRDLPEGTVARGLLKANKALYTGKIDNPDPNAAVETMTTASGTVVPISFPNVIDEFPLPVTKELVDRGQERFNIYCIVCHGPVGNGDGMIVRRGFIAPPTYHDDRLRNAPVGHFFDVITNGFGRMNSYAAQVPVKDRWAIVAYIRALQISQNPDETSRMNSNTTANPPTPAPRGGTNANSTGGGH